jgi:hypothetical protein
MVAVFRATIHSREARPMAQQMSVLGIDIAKLGCGILQLHLRVITCNSVMVLHDL